MPEKELQPTFPDSLPSLSKVNVVLASGTAATGLEMEPYEDNFQVVSAISAEFPAVPQAVKIAIAKIKRVKSSKVVFFTFSPLNSC